MLSDHYHIWIEKCSVLNSASFIQLPSSHDIICNNMDR
uniref:Uncharacterized protein n=1 Tax=Arundo donax TaxID=35708 RepID=A0A0A8ZN56_ARUDO